MADKKSFGKAFNLFKEAFKELHKHDPLLLSSSVAFFTLFSLPPILIIVINILGAVFKEKRISGEVFKTLNEVFGKHSTALIQGIIENVQKLGGNLLITVLGTVFLIFVGTTTFSIVHKALNQIWQVKQKPKSNFIRVFKERIISLAVILFSGILFLASLLLDATVAFLKDYIEALIPDLSSIPLFAINQLFSLIIVTIWFAIIFKFLPNIKIPWKVVWIGASATGILFSIGKYVLGILLINGNISTIYGAAGSMILLLLFLFYSSLILFYGASFTKVFAITGNYLVEPRNYAVFYEINEVKK